MIANKINNKINPHNITMTDDEYLDVYNNNKLLIDTLIKKTVYYQTDYDKIIIHDKVIHFQNFYYYIFKIQQLPEMMIFFAILKYRNNINYKAINMDLSDRLNRLIIEIRLTDFSSELKVLDKRINRIEKNLDIMSYGRIIISRNIIDYKF
jgi:hypothetical protein